jgi:phosphoserine phosphatase RsbU/P
VNAPGTAAGGFPRELLTQLADLSQALALSIDLEQTLSEAAGRIVEYMQAEAASLFLVDAKGEFLVCRACAGPTDVSGLKIPVNAGVVGRTMAENAPQLVRDVREDPDFTGTIDRRTGFVTRSILCAPLSTARGPIGVIQVLNKRAGGLFDDNDRDVLRLLAAPTALALNNATLAQDLIEQNRIKRELVMARRLQRSLFPRRRRDGYPLLALNLPAREISGDFYDYFDLPDGRIAFVVGDVSGKGLDAAFLMVRTASLLRWAGLDMLSPEAWLARVNDEIGGWVTGGMFVCAVAGYYDPATRRALWSSAGFPPVLVQRADGRVDEYPAEAPPLGILPGMAFPSQNAELDGASMYLFSDGVTDVRDEHAELIGMDGVRAMIRRHAALPPEARLRAMIAELRGFALADDTTLMLIEDRTAEGVLLDWRAPAHPDALRDMREKLGQALDKAGTGQELRDQLVLAVHEAACNVIRHAYGGQCCGDMALRVDVRDGRLDFVLRDWAPTVNPDCVRPRDLAECRPGGLGVNFIDALMDEWKLTPASDGEGNILSMSKRLDAAALRRGET